MNEKLKRLVSEVVFAPAGEAVLAFCIMLLLTVGGIVNTAFLGSGVGWSLPIFLLAFALPYLLFALTRGGKRYIPTLHLSLPRFCHIPTLIFGASTLLFGALCLKLTCFEGGYTEFSLYGAFFARRNGDLFRDLYLLLSFCILPPVLEGIIFRGVLLYEHDGRGRLVAATFSSFLYALLSFSFEGFPAQLFIGAMLCILTYATESLAAGIALHIVYNVFAVFFEPTLISIKDVSSNSELFLKMMTCTALLCAFLLASHLSRLYKMYSKKRFGTNSTRSTPRERSAWGIITLTLTLPSLLALALFLTVAVINII